MKAWIPSRSELTDLGFSLLLVTLGVIGFDAAFGGNEAFTVGIPGVVLGVLVGYAIARLRPPVLVGVLAGLVGFFAFGGLIALRPDAIAGVLPSPAVASGLVDGAVNGWVRLITTVPPAGQAGNLLATPYLAGYVGGLLTVVAAFRIRRWPICVIPPVVVLALSVLFGIDEPAFLLLQGAMFGIGTVTWMCLRADRGSRPALNHGSRVRLIGGAVMLSLAAVGAVVVGPRLPGADANPRYVLRDHVQPPFDPSQYPSPLSRFREYHGKDPITKPLFTVEGLPDKGVVRLAVMDAYDGYVWRASPPNSGLGGAYLRVGDRIPRFADGAQSTVRFTMGALAHRDSVWIPTAGSPRAIRFTGKRGDGLTEAFRFNRQTETAASPMALVAGDTWEVDATFPERLSEEQLRSLPAASTTVSPPIGFQDNTDLVELAATWTEGTSSPYAKVVQIDQALKKIGAANDGDKPEYPIASGHSLVRLKTFITAPQPQGNDEQFSAAVAYLAQGVGIPARVVLEFDVGPGKGPVAVKAENAHAVVEVALDGPGWVSIPRELPLQTPDDPPPADTPDVGAVVQPPPPTTVAPPPSIPKEPESENNRLRDNADRSAWSDFLATIIGVARVASIPLVVVGGPILLISGVKARRRKLRRTRGAPAHRIAGGWAEVIDLAKDMGTPVPAKATRREISRFASAGGVGPLAEQIDAAVFGHAEPDDATADALWEGVDTVRAEMLSDKSRVERLRARVSLTSLRSRS